MTLLEMFDELGIPDVLDPQALTAETVNLSVGVLNYFAHARPAQSATDSRTGRKPGRPSKAETEARRATEEAAQQTDPDPEEASEGQRQPGPTQEPLLVSPAETSGATASITGPSSGQPADPETTKISHAQKVELAKLRMDLGLTAFDLKALCEKNGMPRLAPPGEASPGDLTVAEWVLLTTELMPELAAVKNGA